METEGLSDKNWNTTIAIRYNGNMVYVAQKYMPNFTLPFLSSMVTPLLSALPGSEF